MNTILTSLTKTVCIGPDQPFVIIGERINPTGRKMLAAELSAGNFERVRKDALAQVEAGAQMLDVNAGVPLADEPALLVEAIRVVQSVADVPLCLDSSVVKALAAALAKYNGKALVNSVTGEDERLDAILPLIAEHKAAVIGVTNDQNGISHDPDVRFAVAQKIIHRAEAFGIPREDVIIDPLAMPIGAIRYAGATVLKLLRRVHEELGVNTCCGASNVSFGLPGRPSLNAAFIAMLIGAGMSCAITNPIEPEIRKSILAADALMGNDENCAAWLNASRVGALASTQAVEKGSGAAAAAHPARPRPRSTRSTDAPSSEEGRTT